jgi:hypothetical protein
MRNRKDGDSTFDSGEQICRQFSEAWESGNEPDLLAFLEQHPNEKGPRESLFRRLLEIDIEFRRAASGRPSANTADQKKDETSVELYESRFPEFSDIIREVILHDTPTYSHIVAKGRTTHAGSAPEYSFCQQPPEFGSRRR